METQSSERIAQLEKKIESLTQLLEVTAVLNSALLGSSLRVDSMLTYLMDAAATITGSEAASVLLWNDKTHEMFFAATTSDNPDAKSLLGKPVPLDNSVAGTILKERAPIAINDAINDDRVYTKIGDDLQHVTRSLLGVPMIAKDKVIGVLEVINKGTLPWTHDDESSLTMLAEEAAVAIDVAQLVVALRKANTELAEIDKLKSDFIAIASHELRTPLSVILGYASFLQEEESEAISAHASKVMNSALQLRRIIEDMVNLRYLKQSQSELTREKVRVSDVLQDLEKDSLTLTDTREHVITFHVESDATIYADRNRLTMALTNILNNAVRFTPDGGKIEVMVVRRSEREVWIQITDEGIGIESENLERIFDEFQQVEDHMTRHYGGLGIGLSISRALVKAHDGRIWAESAGKDQGSTFTISLPIVGM